MTAEERAKALFAEAKRNFISSMDCPCPDEEMVAEALADARRGALEEAAVEVERLYERPHHVPTRREYAARIRALADLPPATATATKKEGG